MEKKFDQEKTESHYFCRISRFFFMGLPDFPLPGICRPGHLAAKRQYEATAIGQVLQGLTLKGRQIMVMVTIKSGMNFSFLMWLSK